MLEMWLFICLSWALFICIW